MSASEPVCLVYVPANAEITPPEAVLRGGPKWMRPVTWERRGKTWLVKDFAYDSVESLITRAAAARAAKASVAAARAAAAESSDED